MFTITTPGTFALPGPVVRRRDCGGGHDSNHTVTFVVDRAADGTQKIDWLGQNSPGPEAEVPPGRWGAHLQRVPGYTSNSHIWAFKEPDR